MPDYLFQNAASKILAVSIATHFVNQQIQYCNGKVLAYQFQRAYAKYVQESSLELWKWRSVLYCHANTSIRV